MVLTIYWAHSWWRVRFLFRILVDSGASVPRSNTQSFSKHHFVSLRMERGMALNGLKDSLPLLRDSGSKPGMTMKKRLQGKPACRKEGPQ